MRLRITKNIIKTLHAEAEKAENEISFQGGGDISEHPTVVEREKAEPETGKPISQQENGQRNFRVVFLADVSFRSKSAFSYGH